jgi:predicted regulator of Ras-like GTPase activity (Roadblock/LC7/MglB family)
MYPRGSRLVTGFSRVTASGFSGSDLSRTGLTEVVVAFVTEVDDVAESLGDDEVGAVVVEGAGGVVFVVEVGATSVTTVVTFLTS